MIQYLFLSFCLLLNFHFLTAQELKNPLADIETNVVIPESPGENYTWVKPHWEFVKGDYVWMPGVYIENLEFHAWRDGYWVRNQKTGWWVYNPGYWQRVEGNLKINGQESYTNTPSKEPIHQKSVFINKVGMSAK